MTAIAALETGIITPKSTILTKGVYHYGDWAYKCWLYNQNGGTHGRIDVTEAIKVSCNYFFYDIGRRTGISTIARYASAFGLGEPTGIEIPEKIGVMTTPDYVNSLDGHYWTDGQTLTAAIGQSYSLFTPLQLANYVATLAGGGTRYNAHLLKEVRTYDSAEIVDGTTSRRRRSSTSSRRICRRSCRECATWSCRAAWRIISATAWWTPPPRPARRRPAARSATACSWRSRPTTIRRSRWRW